MILACEKSLTYIMNNRGPKIEPCGIIVFIDKTFECVINFLQIVHGLLNNSVIILMLNIPTHNVIIL